MIVSSVSTRAQAAVDEGGALIDFAEVALHTVGMIPGLSALCQKLELAIRASRKVHEFAEDALEMSESVIELGRYLVDLAQLSMRMANDTKRELQIYMHMHQLSDLVGDMAAAIKSFGGQDFFGRILTVVKITKRLVFLERGKDRESLVLLTASFRIRSSCCNLTPGIVGTSSRVARYEYEGSAGIL
jgi:hypothetical protein